MSSMLYRLARLCYRAKWRTLMAWLGVMVALVALTLGVGGKFDDEFTIPGTSSQAALDQLRMTFPQAADASASIVVLAPKGETMDTPAIVKALDEAAKEFEELPYVSAVELPHSKYVKGLISDDRTAGMVSVRVRGYSVSTFTDAQRDDLAKVTEHLQAKIPGGEVHLGGDLFSVSMPKVTIVEGIGVIVALIVLFLVLGSVRGALMPLISALIGAGAALMLIVIAAGLMAINSTTMILALMLALAVGIDYSLFIVSRHRDQLATGMDAEESAARATGTAGSAVVFAGMTVIVALAGLSVAGLPFLTIMGLFAAVAVGIEVVLALTLLPAMLGFAGDKLRPKPNKRSLATGGPSRWWVNIITKVPVITVVVVVALLGILSIPMKDLQLALPNSGRNLPGKPDRITFDLISQRFGVGYNGPLVITGTIVESNDPLGIVSGIAADVEKMEGVKLVALAVPNENADTALIQIIPKTGPDDPKTAELVAQLRGMEQTWYDKYKVHTAVTGYTAAAIDISQRLGATLLPFAVFVVGLSLVLLTMVFRSIWVPIKAALGYLLSVGSAFGLTALVFNQGVFKEVINLPEPLPVISFLPIILMGILFGLAMDYEVFLTSRMREEYVHGNEETPVQEGFVHSAKVVVAAAVIMFSVFAFFVPAGEGVIKPIAFGLAIGVAIDAFFVRMTMGPAILKLLGNHAWWLPRWLDRVLPVMDVEGEALAHQLDLADWPSPDSTHVVYGEGLTVKQGSHTILDAADVSLQPGEVLVISGDHRARQALLLALTGRLKLASGRLKVLGHVLPEEAGAVRSASTYLSGVLPDVERHLENSTRDFVVLDDADRLSPAGRDLLRRTVAEGVAAHRSFVIGVAHEDSVRDLLPADVQTLAAGEPEPALGGVR